MTCRKDMHMIIAIVKKGWGDKTLAAMTEAGVDGGTIVYGHGMSNRQLGLLGMALSPEREIIYVAVDEAILDVAIEAAIAGGEMTEPGNGICMSTPLSNMYRASRQDVQEETTEEKNEE